MPTPGVGSTWPLWIDSLVTQMRSQTGYRHPNTFGSAIPVYDGPEVSLSGENARTYLVIGWSGDDEPESPGNNNQTMATAGNSHNKDEKGVITARSVAQLGDSDWGAVKRARDKAVQAMIDVELFIRASPGMTLGVTGTVRLAQVTGARFEQWLDEGACCAVTFDIGYEARI